MPTRNRKIVMRDIYANAESQEQLLRLSKATLFSAILAALDNNNFEFARSLVTQTYLDGDITEADKDFVLYWMVASDIDIYGKH